MLLQALRLVCEHRPRIRFSWGILFVVVIVSLAQTGHADELVYDCPPGLTKHTILPGTVVTCAIGTYDASHDFEFTGRSGERFIALLAETGDRGAACIQVYGPSGAPALPQESCSFQTTRGEFTVSEAGKHNIRVRAAVAPAEFTLTLERLSPPTASAIFIVPGQTRLGEIGPIGDYDLYRFTASAGQVLSVRASGPGSPCVAVFGPTGASFSGFCVSQASITASAAGTYTVLVGTPQSQQTPYSLLLQCLSGCPPPPPLDLSQCILPRSLQVSALVGSAPRSRFIKVGDGSLPNCSLPTSAAFTAEFDLLNGQGSNWLSGSPQSGTFRPGDDLNNKVPVIINPSNLGPGTYQGLIRINIPSLNAVLRIPVTLTLNSARPQLLLSWNSFVFQTVALSEDAASGPPASQTLRLYNGVSGTINWSVSRAELPGWLNLACQTTCTTTASQISGTAGSEPGQGSRLTISVDRDHPDVRDVGVHPHLLEIRASDASNSPASNSPQYVSITFYAVRRTAAPIPLLTSYGLVFNATQGGPSPPPQSFVFSNTGGNSISVQFSPITYPGGSWLSLSTSSANTSQGPVTVNVSVNSAAVSPGTHRAKIIATFTTSVAREPQEVDVILVVSPAAVALQRTDAPANGCAPTGMQLVGTTIGNGLSTPVSFPQILLAQVVDTCGQAVTGATAVATAEGLTIPMPEVGGGFYSGTWTPQQAAAGVPVSFAVLHPSFATVQQAFTVSTVPGSGGQVLPVLLGGGVVEAAGFAPDRPLAPGSIIALFGTNLAPSIASATQIPLERQLAGTSVRIGNVTAPLYFVSPGQINAQLPYEAVPGDTVSIVVNTNGRLTTPQTYQIAPAQPGIFLAGSNGIIIKFSNGQLVSAQNPARANDVLVIFTTSLGLTNPPVATGVAAIAAEAVVLASVTIGGVPATVSYAGLTPSLVGLYQVNVIVPPGVTPGPAEVVVTQNGIPSNPLQSITIPIVP